MDITSLSINANKVELGRGIDFPHKLRMCPDHSYFGMVYQSMLWEMFQCHRLTTFSTPEYLDLRQRSDLDDQTFGVFDYLFPTGTETGGNSADFVLDPQAPDYYDVIEQAKALGGKCFVLYLDISTHGKLLEQAYSKGMLHEDTLVFVSDRVFEGNLRDYMSADAPFAEIMKGTIAAKWNPLWKVQNSDHGKTFLNKFINLPGAPDCYPRMMMVILSLPRSKMVVVDV